MHFSRLTVVAFGVVVGAACGALGGGAFAAPAADQDPAAELGLPANVAAAMRGIDAERIRAHVRYLSDDLLEGRGTGTRGGDMAAKYIATQFALGRSEAGGGQRRLPAKNRIHGRAYAAGHDLRIAAGAWRPRWN